MCIVMCEKMLLADIGNVYGGETWPMKMENWTAGIIRRTYRFSWKKRKKSSDGDCWDLNKSFWWIRMFWTCGMMLIGSNVQQWTWMELIIKQRRRPRKTRWNGVEQDTETEGLVCPKLQTFGTNFICLFFYLWRKKMKRRATVENGRQTGVYVRVSTGWSGNARFRCPTCCGRQEQNLAFHSATQTSDLWGYVQQSLLYNVSVVILSPVIS